MFALGRAKLVNALALPLIALHVLATALGGALFGADGVVGAFFVAPLAFAIVLLVVGAGRGSVAIARELARDGAALRPAGHRLLRPRGRARRDLLRGPRPGCWPSWWAAFCYGLMTSRLAPRQVRAARRRRPPSLHMTGAVRSPAARGPAARRGRAPACWPTPTRSRSPA